MPTANRFEILFNQVADPIFSVDAGGAVVDVNDAACALTGYLRSEWVGANIAQITTEKEKFLSEGRSDEIKILRKDGFPRWVDLSVKKIGDSQGVLYLALLRDWTERRQMERELITKHSELKIAYLDLERKTSELQAMQETLVQSGKMSALGELAAGIAHELNQPLQAIRGYSQELASVVVPALNAGEKGEAQKYIGFIVQGVDRMRAIIDYLRAFTRKSTEGEEWVDLEKLIPEAFKLLGKQLKSRGIDLQIDASGELPLVFANPLALEQVFINLGTNARDAIEAAQRDSGRIKISFRHDKKFVEVSVQDNGIGMNEKTKSRIFNPFFTTKEVGQGMGLGLSLSYGILSKIRGGLVVESMPGQGSTFKVRVPIDYRET